MKGGMLWLFLLFGLAIPGYLKAQEADRFDLDRLSYVNGETAKESVGHSGMFDCALDDFSVLADWGDGTKEFLRKEATADSEGIVHANGQIYKLYSSHAYKVPEGTELPITYAVSIEQHAHCRGGAPDLPYTKGYPVVVSRPKH